MLGRKSSLDNPVYVVHNDNESDYQYSSFEITMRRIKMGVICDTDKPSVLSSSNIGTITKCGCCDSYHLCLGCLTLRLEHKSLLALTQMIIEALEVNSAIERGHEIRKHS
jgi:hypothetical protein